MGFLVDLMVDQAELVERIKRGEVIVYPTDTIYGIGCNALNSGGVKRIREIKKRDTKPFSVIVPGKSWIRKNCFVDERVEKWLDKLPGPFTLILELKKRKAIVREVNNFGESLGVRIPKHWFAEVIEEAGVPFVTTSVNLSGKKPIGEVGEISAEIREKIDYVIDEGKIEGRPSTVVNLLGEREDVRVR